MARNHFDRVTVFAFAALGFVAGLVLRQEGDPVETGLRNISSTLIEIMSDDDYGSIEEEAPLVDLSPQVVAQRLESSVSELIHDPGYDGFNLSAALVIGAIGYKLSIGRRGRGRYGNGFNTVHTIPDHGVHVVGPDGRSLRAAAFDAKPEAPRLDHLDGTTPYVSAHPSADGEPRWILHIPVKNISNSEVLGFKASVVVDLGGGEKVRVAAWQEKIDADETQVDIDVTAWMLDGPQFPDHELAANVVAYSYSDSGGTRREFSRNMTGWNVTIKSPGMGWDI